MKSLAFSGLMTPVGMNWKEYFLCLENANARLLVALLSKTFFQSITCLKEVYGVIRKGLVIIPVWVEESENEAVDIARDLKSMWPGAMIEKDVRSQTSNDIAYSKKLRHTKLQRLNVKDELRNANTLPPGGSLLIESNALMWTSSAEFRLSSQNTLLRL